MLLFFSRALCFVFAKNRKRRTRLVPSGWNWGCASGAAVGPTGARCSRLAKRTAGIKMIPPSHPTSHQPDSKSLSACADSHGGLNVRRRRRKMRRARKQARTWEQLAAAAVEIGLGRQVLQQPWGVKLKAASLRLLLFIYFLHVECRCVRVIAGNPHFSNCKHTGWEIRFASGKNRPVDWSKPGRAGWLLARPK